MRNKIVTAVAAIAAIALAAWGGYVFCTQVTIGENAELYALIPVYIILVLLGAALDELIHEGAHFLVGACCSMGVKPPKIRLFRSSSIEFSPRGAKAMRFRFVLTAGAGLFFDFLLIILGIIAFAVPSVPALFGITLPYALYSFIINAVPFEYSTGKTDGCQLAEAFSHSPSSQVLFTILRVQGMVNDGVPLKEIDEGMLIDLPQLPEDDLYFIILTQLRYEYYLAKGDDPTAYKYFLRYKDLIQYLPSEYGGAATARRKVEAEMEEEEEAALDLEDVNALKKGKKARKEKKKQEATETEETQAEAAEQPEQPEEAAQPEQPEQTEQKDE